MLIYCRPVVGWTIMARKYALTRRQTMTESVSVAEAKSRFSELVNRASYGRERFLIERRGKPVGAIVSAEDLARLEEGARTPGGRGLLAAVGALADVEELDEILAQIQRERETAVDREVDLG
jgi:prevent-host-death family protein